LTCLPGLFLNIFKNERVAARLWFSAGGGLCSLRLRAVVGVVVGQQQQKEKTSWPKEIFNAKEIFNEQQHYKKPAVFAAFRVLDVDAANDADGLVAVAARVEQQQQQQQQQQRKDSADAAERHGLAMDPIVKKKLGRRL
jgi:hypothetical protein